MNGSNVFLFHDRVFKKVAVFFCCSFHFPKLGWDCNDQSDFQKPGVEGGNASISLDSRKIMWHRTACDLKNVTSTIMWQGTKPWLFFFFLSPKFDGLYPFILPNRADYFAHVPQLSHQNILFWMNERMNDLLISVDSHIITSTE